MFCQTVAAKKSCVASPVRWEDVVRRMAADGVTAFVEVGPGAVLSGLGRKIARDLTFLNVDAPEHLAGVESLFSGQRLSAGS